MYATQSNYWREFFSALAESWKKLNTSNVFSSFTIEISPLLREFLSNNSLFDGQLYEDKSLSLHSRDLIFLKTDLKKVNCYSTIHC